MGMSFETYHIPDGDEQVLRTLMPHAVVGKWSDRFVSFCERGEPVRFTGNIGCLLSKQIQQSVLYFWVYDEDTLGAVVFRDGKKAAEHIFSSDFKSKLGDIPAFCRLLGLPSEDKSRLRTIWKKGDYRQQLEYTQKLLGAPLFFTADYPPTEKAERAAEQVDAWIAAIPAPVKPRMRAEPVQIQEIPCFRAIIHNGKNGMVYVSGEPWDSPYLQERDVFWITESDGTLRRWLETPEHLYYSFGPDRLFGKRYNHDSFLFDSAGLLKRNFSFRNEIYMIQGGLLMVWDKESDTYSCRERDGTLRWEYARGKRYLACAEGVALFASEADGVNVLETVDLTTGKMCHTYRANARWSSLECLYADGIWWVVFSFLSEKDGKRSLDNSLVKMSEELQLLGSCELPKMLRGMKLSQDGHYLYINSDMKQHLCVDTHTMMIEHTLNHSAYRHLVQCDRNGRVWMMGSGTTMEAWSEDLKTLLLRTKLKGEICGTHLDQEGNACAAVFDRDNLSLRIYRMNQIS